MIKSNKNNIWRLFLVVVLIELFVVAIINYNITKQDRIQTKREHIKIVNIAAETVSVALSRFENVLNILSIAYKYKSKNEVEYLMNILQHSTSLMYGIVFINKNGDVEFTTKNISKKIFLNFLENKKTKKDFIYTLDHPEKTFIGRTYRPLQFKFFVMPVRKAITKNGIVAGVFGIGLRLDENFNFLADNKSKNIYLFRDSDLYVQYAPNCKDPKERYNTPIPKVYMNILLTKIQNIYKISLSQIKNNEKTIQIEYKDFHNNPSLVTLKYIKKYQLWLISFAESPSASLATNKITGYVVILFLFITAVLGLLFFWLSQSEKNKNNAILDKITRDELTNLRNRYYLLKYKDTILKKHHKLSLFIIDIDNFQAINNLYGYSIGDDLLRTIAKRLKFFAKENKAVLIRNSGDEFILILPEIDSRKVASLAKKLLSLISKEFKILNYSITPTISIGIARYSKDAHSFETLEKFATLSLNKAKEKGNSFYLFNNNIKESYHKRKAIESELWQAIDKQELYPVYQLQIKNNGEIYGIETLLRWKNEKLGYVSPSDFIKIAEKTNIIKEIGDFIIDKALEDYKYISDKTNMKMQISINISAKQFMSIGFLDSLLFLIDKHKVEKKYITLEITENLFVEDLELLLDLLENIREEGIKISLDDFGTGYSSLNFLNKLPIDELKIDKTFIENIAHEKKAKEILDFILELGKKLNIDVLAEGIETVEQKEILESFNCSIYQGYLFSKPLTRDELIECIKNKSFREKK